MTFLCVSVSPLLQGTLAPTLAFAPLNQLHLQRPYIQKRSHSEVPGGHEFGRDTIQPSAEPQIIFEVGEHKC